MIGAVSCLPYVFFCLHSSNFAFSLKTIIIIIIIIIIISATALRCLWLSCYVGYVTIYYLCGGVVSPTPTQPPAWWTRVYLFDLSGMGGTTCSYAVASAAPSVI